MLYDCGMLSSVCAKLETASSKNNEILEIPAKNLHRMLFHLRYDRTNNNLIDMIQRDKCLKLSNKIACQFVRQTGRNLQVISAKTHVKSQLVRLI